ncbi:MAG: site-2 protease family protein [PVC group bacterium]
MEVSAPSDWALFTDVSEVMEIASWGHEGAALCFRGRLKVRASEASRLLAARAREYGLRPFLQREGEGAVFRFVPVGRARPEGRKIVHLLLFLATLLSTLLVGALMTGPEPKDILSRPLLILKGVPFSFTLLLILGFHEFSHYFVSRRYGIRTSLPYFIPFPNLLGTMGAVIISRSPFPDRKSLFDVGIAGPLASFVLSAGAIFLGFSEIALVRTNALLLRPEPGLYLGDSLLTAALFSLRYHPIPPGYDISLGPISFAGWVGLFVTALNLLPMGQLDGGHISYALCGRRHELITKITVMLLALFGLLFSSPFWIFIAVMIAVLSPRHAPPLEDITPLNPARICLALLAFLILAACFIPVPLRMVG